MLNRCEGELCWGKLSGFKYYLGPGFLLVLEGDRPVVWASQAGVYAVPDVDPEEVINLVLDSLSEPSPPAFFSLSGTPFYSQVP